MNKLVLFVFLFFLLVLLLWLLIPEHVFFLGDIWIALGKPGFTKRIVFAFWGGLGFLILCVLSYSYIPRR